MTTNGTIVLSLPMPPNDAGARTVREYLVTLLGRLWDNGKAFNPKRPFGDGDWEAELYAALVDGGLVKADEDGALDLLEAVHADSLIFNAIEALR